MLAGEKAIRVKAGDFIGLHYSPGQTEDVISYAQAPQAMCLNKVTDDPGCFKDTELYITYSLPLNDDDLVGT